MKKQFIIFLMLVSIAGTAQNDSIRAEILNRENSKIDLINKGRKLLMEKFIEADYQKVKEVKDYLVNEVENANYLAFYTEEQWLIMFWTKEYEKLLKGVINHDPSKIPWPQQVLPEEDFLGQTLAMKTAEEKIVLRSSIKVAELDDEKKQFLLMFLDYLIFDYANPRSYQEKLNNMADDFLNAHPNSVYEDFTREHIRYITKEADWGFGGEFFSGYGIFTDRLSENFSNNIPMGFAFEAEYKKINFSLRNYIGFGKLKKNIPYSGGDWERNSRYTVFVPELAIGYSVLENSRLKLIPFVGIGGTSFSATEKDREAEPSLKEIGAVIVVNYTVGFGLDFKLEQTNNLLFGGEENAYWLIRLRYAYAAPQLGARFEGNMHNISIGIGGFGRKLKQVR